MCVSGLVVGSVGVGGGCSGWARVLGVDVLAPWMTPVVSMARVSSCELPGRSPGADFGLMRSAWLVDCKVTVWGSCNETVQTYISDIAFQETMFKDEMKGRLQR